MRKQYCSIIVQIALILLVWILVPILYDFTIDKWYFILPEAIVNDILIIEREVVIYLICGLLIGFVFIKSYGLSVNLYKNKIEIKKIKLICAVIIVYSILICMSIICGEYNFENLYVVRAIIINVLVIALTEEFSFRRIVITQLDRAIKNQNVTILISAVLFAAVHIVVYCLQFYEWTEINTNILLLKSIYLLIMGGMLGIIYIKSKSLILCIIVHGCQNVLAEFLYIDEISSIVLYFLGLAFATALVIYSQIRDEKENKK